MSDRTLAKRRAELAELGIEYANGTYMAKPNTPKDFGFGTDWPNHAGLQPEPEPPEAAPVRGAQSPDLQGFFSTRTPNSLKESTSAEGGVPSDEELGWR